MCVCVYIGVFVCALVCIRVYRCDFVCVLECIGVCSCKYWCVLVGIMCIDVCLCVLLRLCVCV